MLLKTANQSLAALILAGGVVALAALLLFTNILAPFDLVLGWDLAHGLAIYALITEEYLTIDASVEHHANTAIVIVVASLLSYGTGLLLALRLLLARWRETLGAANILFIPNRLLAALILLSGAFAGGTFLWYMDYTSSNVILTWLNIRFIVAGQLSEYVHVEPNAYPDIQVRAANLTLAALALSYVLSQCLAVSQLWHSGRAILRHTREKLRALNYEDELFPKQ